MIDIVGYTAVKNGYTIYYHAACSLRLRMFRMDHIPAPEDGEPILRGDPREHQECSACCRPLSERSPVRKGLDDPEEMDWRRECAERRAPRHPPPVDDDPL